MSCILRLALVILAAIPSTLVAQDSRFDVEFKPASRPIGIEFVYDSQATRAFEVRPLFGGETAWLELDDSSQGERGPAGAPPAPPAPEVGPKERWLMSTVKSRFTGVTTAETVEKSTVRHDGASRNVARQRGIEAKGSREAVASVREFFDRFKAGSKRVVTIEMRLLEVTGEPEPRDTLKSVATIATRQEFERRVRELEARGAGSILSPTVKVFANQTASVSAVEQISYIKDYNVEVVSGQKIADPVVGVVNDGIEIEMTPIYDPDGGALIVTGSVKLSDLERPIREHRTKLGDIDVTIQLPSVVSHRWSGEVKLEPGQNVFTITGLRHRSSHKDRDPGRPVEVWCLVTLEDGASAGVPTGEIVDRDEKNGNVFVSFPRETVPDDPWNKAPKEVDVYRRGEKIGTARLAGGWVLPSNPTHPVIAIYQLAEGTPRDGDSVKLASTR